MLEGRMSDAVAAGDPLAGVLGEDIDAEVEGGRSFFSLLWSLNSSSRVAEKQNKKKRQKRKVSFARFLSLLPFLAPFPQAPRRTSSRTIRLTLLLMNRRNLILNLDIRLHHHHLLSGLEDPRSPSTGEGVCLVHHIQHLGLELLLSLGKLDEQIVSYGSLLDEVGECCFVFSEFEDASDVCHGSEEQG